MATRVEEAGIDFFTGFAGVEVLWDGTRVSGVRTGDRGIDKEGRPKATFEAGRGHPREGHHLLRRRPRQPDQAAAGEAAAGGRAGAAAVRHRDQGAVGSSGGPHRRRHGDAHARLSAQDGRVRRRVLLRDAGRPHLSRAGCRPRLSRSDVRSVRRVSAPEGASAHRGPACRRAAGEVRREGAARKRLEQRPAAVDGRRPDRRRRGRVPELVPAEGHSSGDEDRDARGGDGVRGGSRGRHVGHDAPRRIRIESIEAGCARSCTRCATCTRRSTTACSPA